MVDRGEEVAQGRQAAAVQDRVQAVAGWDLEGAGGSDHQAVEGWARHLGPQRTC